MKTLHYRDIIGKRVISSDGRDLGRLRNLFAERDGDDLRVTQLLVGPEALLQRMGIAKSYHRCIPWSLVEVIDKDIRLSPRAEDK